MRVAILPLYIEKGWNTSLEENRICLVCILGETVNECNFVNCRLYWELHRIMFSGIKNMIEMDLNDSLMV